MAARMDQNFLTNFALFLFLFNTAVFVQGEDCPQQSSGSESTNQKARNLAGSGQFSVVDSKKRYEYTINLCKLAKDDTAVLQRDLKNKGKKWDVGYYANARVFGGSNWLMIQYSGENYSSHCLGSPRRSIFYISCDRSANTKEKRQPRILEEYRPDTPTKVDPQFCYYLFEMKHDGVCPVEKTKISPGSVFIIIIVIIGVLYLVLGLLYQRFIVGAKGMEQIPNYLMWREFGTLQADGCSYMCRCKGTREATRYKPMDDAIADDEDFSADNDDNNDDAMLPM
ncbi:Hypothetical predicted protein [Paramuricea clavata]|uniref:Uncharacterized protein n=1 Tax=Paramuricea clavata TaxID=317549 RepID=A0A6S7H631_PARCT|nr:Hypothetical predicted protein [Paramuricea clavata]